MAKLKALWHEVRDSLWFLPSVLTLAGAGLAVALVSLGDRVVDAVGGESVWWLFGGSPEGAQGVLSAISGSIITVTGVVFSVTIVALQLASSQFTPRVLRQFTADRANQVVLGVFIGTFTYTLLVQRTIRTEDGGEAFVPHLAVTGAVLLALTSIGFLIFFINHAARSIQASVILASVTTDTLRVIHNVFPEPLLDGSATFHTVEEFSGGRQEAPHRVAADRAGYVQAINIASLRDAARTGQVMIQLEIEIGRHLLPGQHVASIWPAADATSELERAVCASLILGMERTPHQDMKLGVVELMDMAVKALSPSVNDPTTAMHAIDRLGEVLLAMSWRQRGDRIELSDDGRPLVLMRQPRLEDVTALGINQVRHFAADNATVSSALLWTLGDLAALGPAAARSIFLEHVHAVQHTALGRIRDERDREHVQSSAARALARASEPVA